MIIREGRVNTVQELTVLATELAALVDAGDLLILTGELGAGKTTFTRAFAQALGITETVSSPTFIVARQHHNPSGPALIHLDAYRLDGFIELDDLDLDFERSITVAEWGKGVIEPEFDSWLELELFPEYGDQEIELEQDSPRRFRLSAFGPRWDNLLGKTL